MFDLFDDTFSSSLKRLVLKVGMWIGFGYLLRQAFGYVVGTTALWFLIWSCIFIFPTIIIRFGIVVDGVDSETTSNGKDLLSIIYTSFILLFCFIPSKEVAQSSIEMAIQIYSAFSLILMIFYYQGTIFFFFKYYRLLYLAYLWIVGIIFSSTVLYLGFKSII